MLYSSFYVGKALSAPIGPFSSQRLMRGKRKHPICFQWIKRVRVASSAMPPNPQTQLFLAALWCRCRTSGYLFLFFYRTPQDRRQLPLMVWYLLLKSSNKKNEVRELWLVRSKGILVLHILYRCSYYLIYFRYQINLFLILNIAIILQHNKKKGGNTL